MTDREKSFDRNIQKIAQHQHKTIDEYIISELELLKGGSE